MTGLALIGGLFMGLTLWGLGLLLVGVIVGTLYDR